MKRIQSLTAIAAIAFIIASCGGKSTQESESTEAASESAVEATAETTATYTVNTDASEVAWKGEVAGVYGHNGVINIQEGSFTTAGDKVVEGTVVIDMTSIQPLDTASYEASGKTPQDLVDHLTTEDFFLVGEYPTATFVVTSHMDGKLVGDLTIRGNTNEETVELSSLDITESGLSGEGKLVFDRQKYDVKWEHYVQDYVLSDNIELTISIDASK